MQSSWNSGKSLPNITLCNRIGDTATSWQTDPELVSKVTSAMGWYLLSMHAYHSYLMLSQLLRVHQLGMDQSDKASRVQEGTHTFSPVSLQQSLACPDWARASKQGHASNYVTFHRLRVQGILDGVVTPFTAQPTLGMPTGSSGASQIGSFNRR